MRRPVFSLLANKTKRTKIDEILKTPDYTKRSPSDEDKYTLSFASPIPKEKRERKKKGRVFQSYAEFWKSLTPEEREFLKQKYRKLEMPLPL